jgi:hypothetical protein
MIRVVAVGSLDVGGDEIHQMSLASRPITTHVLFLSRALLSMTFRWSIRELYESLMLIEGASKINRLLRLTTLVMPPGSMSHQLRRPEESECALKIEGHSYAMVHAGDHDSASLQFYLMGPDGESRRRVQAGSSNGYGGPVSPDIVEYFAKVLEQTHADIKNVCETLRDDGAATELRVIVDTAETANVVRTHSALTATGFANTPNHRDVVIRKSRPDGTYDRMPPDHPLYETWTYPMYFWHAERGWCSNSDTPTASPRISSFLYQRGRMHIPERVKSTPASFHSARPPGAGFVDLKTNPTLSFAVDIAKLTRSQLQGATYRCQPRDGDVLRLPANRFQLTPWLNQEYGALCSRDRALTRGTDKLTLASLSQGLDSFCRTQEQSFKWIRNNQSKLLRYSPPDTERGDGATAASSTQQSVHLPSSVSGSRQHLSNKTADGLAVAARCGKPALFVTVTTNSAWAEIRRRLPRGASPFDYPDLVCRVFHSKMVALKARMLSGSIWGPCTVEVDGSGNASWSYKIKGAHGNGYLISVIEFQQRGMPHAHIVMKVRAILFLNVVVSRVNWCHPSFSPAPASFLAFTRPPARIFVHVLAVRKRRAGRGQCT